MIVSAVFAVVLFGVMIQSSSESLSYKNLSNYHLPSWRPKTSDATQGSNENSPLLTPSNMTLELESGNITNVPSHLKKVTPNFHLLMPATYENVDFCKTLLSSMLLNYPPPTILNFEHTYETNADVEHARLQAIHLYLRDTKHVKDEDLVLIVDGYDVWFQLPSDVMIKQYQNILREANERLAERYGFTDSKITGEPARPWYNQTVIWGAEKVCSTGTADSLGCAFVPDSTLPKTIYGRKTDKSTPLTRAKYLNSGTVIGPAGDLRAIFDAATSKISETAFFSRPSVQTVLADLFGEQEYAREATRQSTLSAGATWRDWLATKLGKPHAKNMTLLADHRYEFSMGLDYTHSLFQPLTTTAPEELLLLFHNNATLLNTHHHANTPTQPLALPHALLASAPPFVTPNPNNDPSPNGLPSLTVPLLPNKDLDALPPPNTSWADIPLLTNTYTGAIPALIHLNMPPPPPLKRGHAPFWDNPTEINSPPPTAQGGAISYSPSPSTSPSLPPFPLTSIQTSNSTKGSAAPPVTWTTTWFHPHARALLRRYLRTPQGALAFHEGAVGGDAWWDMRGGSGGVFWGWEGGMVEGGGGERGGGWNGGWGGRGKGFRGVGWWRE